MNAFDRFDVAGPLLVALGTLPLAGLMARLALMALIALLVGNNQTASRHAR